MNTAVSNSSHATPSFPASDVYDSDDVGGLRSPVMMPVNPKLSPSPSPEPVGPIIKIRAGKGARKNGMRSNMGESVLIHHMANGNHPEISRGAALSPIDPEDEDNSVRGTSATVSTTDEDSKSVLSDERIAEDLEPENIAQIKNEKDHTKILDQNKHNSEHLRVLAARAYSSFAKEQTPERTSVTKECSKAGTTLHAPTGELMEDVKTSLPSIKVDDASSRSILEASTIKSPDALPPIQPSPVSSDMNAVTLPSISSTLGDMKLPETPRDVAFPQSPPPPPLFNHGSPPHSPHDYRALPSPGTFFFQNQQRRHSHADQHTYMNNIDYSGSSNVETPSDKSTPGSSLGLHRMSIDGLDNPQIGGFQCTFSGCTAAPFQTQVRPHLVSSNNLYLI